MGVKDGSDPAEAEAPCEALLFPFPTGTVRLSQPIARVLPGGAERHRILLPSYPYGTLTAVRSPASERTFGPPSGREIALERGDERGALLFDETDVDVSTGKGASAAYDLALHRDPTDRSRGILTVTSLLQMFFVPGVSTRLDTLGKILSWDDAEKESYVQTFIMICERSWSGRHDLVEISGKGAIRRIGVEVRIKVFIEGVHTSEHWEATVQKADRFSPTSSVNAKRHTAKLDSLDFKWKNITPGAIQFGAAHEFGHMLGLPDEYDTAPAYAKAWTADRESMMNAGSEVRERHYAPFADWVTRQFRSTSRLLHAPIVYKVNGTTDLSNAELNL